MIVLSPPNSVNNEVVTNRPSCYFSTDALSSITSSVIAVASLFFFLVGFLQSDFTDGLPLMICSVLLFSQSIIAMHYNPWNGLNQKS